MSLMERFGFDSWSPAERDALLSDISTLLERS
jgi:hypothetical protein